VGKAGRIRILRCACHDMQAVFMRPAVEHMLSAPGRLHWSDVEASGESQPALRIGTIWPSAGWASTGIFT